MPDRTLDRAALTVLLDTVGGDREFLGELIETYLADSPALFVELHAGLASGDATAVRRAAHTLKSTSATFGATRLAEIAKEIETAAAAGDLTGLGPRVEAAQAEFDAVGVELQAVAAEGVGP
jgi:HPt (histidine-containing phosphotransfer) domain-containing protein